MDNFSDTAPESETIKTSLSSLEVSSTDERLTNYIERIETLEEEKSALASEIRDVYAEAKIEGFDPKVLKQVVRLRKLEPQERDEQQSLLNMYMQALGMFESLPH